MKRLKDFLNEKKKDDPCWKGYTQYGMKKKGEKEVPNCVKEELECIEESSLENMKTREIHNEFIRRGWTPIKSGSSGDHDKYRHEPTGETEMIPRKKILPIGTKRSIIKTLNRVTPIKEDWQSVNRKDKTDGLSQKAVNAYRRENPGSKLQTAVTEKNPKGKRAKRRKSFCSRMSGMKKRLTSAKNARDPDSPINKALRRWNC